MSIVAVRVYPEKVEIASDSILVNEWTQSKSNNTFAKLVKVNNMVVGSSGTAEEGSLFQIYCLTRRPEQASEVAIINFFSEFADWKNNKIGNASINCSYIFVVEGKAFYIENFFVEEIVNYMAIGAGRDFALAALHLGHDVRKAVEVACELSILCELPVKSFEVTKE